MEMVRDERVYMVWGSDELGDAHTFTTSSQERALLEYGAMQTRFGLVRYN